MDLRCLSLGACLQTEPRLRGDGPALKNLRTMLPDRTPPTRGWTSRVNGGDLIVSQNPAYAGMDLLYRLYHIKTSSEPRLRGDGPTNRSSEGTDENRTPPTRGWT